MQHPTSFKSLKTLVTALAAATLAACGGGGGGDSSDPGTTPPPTATSKFTQNATWTFTLPAAGSSVCYDFDARAQAACTGNQWDVKVVSGGRSAELFTNSGPSSADGTGNGGAFGTPFVHTWTDLQKWNDALVDPVGGALPTTVYTADTAKSAFSGSNAIQSAAYEYDLNGTHQMHPNFRVFLITTNSASSDISGSAGDVYALQVTGYYGSPTGTASGWPSFRWINRAAAATPFSAPVNASPSPSAIRLSIARRPTPARAAHASGPSSARPRPSVIPVRHTSTSAARTRSFSAPAARWASSPG